MVDSERALSAEQLEIRALARDFAENEIRGRSRSWDEARALGDGILAAIAEMGFFGMLVPERRGGLEFDMLTYLLVMEELAWGDASVALTVAIQNGPVAQLLLRRGSEGVREAVLPRLASGEALAAFALSEPGAGSDAGGLRCRAVREDGGWRISGRKRWITNGARADVVLLFARTATEEDEAGRISAFLVDRESEGYRVEGRERTLGLRASETVHLHLENLFVREDRLVGEAGQGFRYAMEGLDVGRLGVAALSLGIARAAFEHAVGYARERRQFGRRIASFGAIQTKIAEMATRIAAARALTHDVARAMDGARGADGGEESRRFTTESAMAKLVASEAAMWISDEAVQTFGGYGYMRDYPVEKLMRDAKGTEIIEGTSEILRMVIAREVVGPEERRR